MFWSVLAAHATSPLYCPEGLQGLAPNRTTHVPANAVLVGWYANGAARDTLALWGEDGEEVEAESITYRDDAIELVPAELVPGELYSFGRDDWQVGFRVDEEVDGSAPRPPTDVSVEDSYGGARGEITVEWTASDADLYRVRVLGGPGEVLATAWTSETFVTLGEGPCGGPNLGNDALRIEVLGRDLAGNESKPMGVDLAAFGSSGLLYCGVGCETGPGGRGLAALAILLLAARLRRRLG